MHAESGTSTLEQLKRMVAIPSVFGSERDIAEYVKGALEGLGCVRIEKVNGFGGNVVAECINDERYPTLILNGHCDTVPVMQGWKTDPFKAVVRDGNLYGLGACDMKAGLAINMSLYKHFSSKKCWRANLIFVGACDEEGNSKGSFLYLEKLKKDRRFSKERLFAMLTEPTNEAIMLGCRGRYVVEIVVKGISAHGARPYLGINAIDDAAKIVETLADVPIREHPRLGKGSVCVLKIEGGGESLSVPDTCIIRLDRHVVPPETMEDVMSDVKRAASKANVRSKVEYRWMSRPTPFLEPYEIKRSNAFAKNFINVVKRTGTKPQLIYGASVGDFNLFGNVMPTLVYGPKGAKWHSPGEYVEVESVKRCEGTLARFLDKLPDMIGTRGRRYGERDFEVPRI